MEEDVVEVEEEEVTLMGTSLMAAAAVTTPVATPMGMTTYGLEIVVKLDAFRSPESEVDKAVAPLLSASHLFATQISNTPCFPF
jgi:hypothetical protein